MLNAAGTVVVEARDVTVAIAGRPVLRGNNLTVREGEFIALMGANGSGKSTLVRALTGLRPLTQGSIHASFVGAFMTRLSGPELPGSWR